MDFGCGQPADRCELGYHGPSAAGRALRHGRADAVGIVYAEQLSYAFRDPYAVTLFGAVADVLEENGISINLLPIPNDSPADPAGVAYAVVDGFLAIWRSDTHPGVIAARRRGIPVVLTVASTLDGDFVTIDEPAAGRSISVGRRRLHEGRRTCVVEDARAAHLGQARRGMPRVTACHTGPRGDGRRARGASNGPSGVYTCSGSVRCACAVTAIRPASSFRSRTCARSWPPKTSSPP